MAYVYKPQVTRLKAGRRVRQRTKFYWGCYRGADGREVKHALRLPNGDRVTRKDLAESLLRDLETGAQRRSLGLPDSVPACRRGLTSLVDAFVDWLRLRDCNRKYVKTTEARLRWWAEQLPDALGAVTSDHCLRAYARLDSTLSHKTRFDYRAVLFGFFAWCQTNHDEPRENPARNLPVPCKEPKTRRRALTRDEAGRLFRHAGHRELFYRMAIYTGLRMKELLSLQWRDIVFEPGYIELRASTAKSGTGAKLPLHPVLKTALLVEHAQRSPADMDPVFFSAPKWATFQTDLVRAGIPRLDANGRKLDRHALRTTFVSWLASQGTNPRVTQALARHSDIRLTMGAYTDEQLLPLREAVDQLT